MTSQDKAASVINARAARHRKPFTILEIASEAIIDFNTARKIVTSLVLKGHLRRVSKPCGPLGHRGYARYELVKMIPTRPPVQRVKIWRSMRMMRRFTISDLCATATASNHNVSVYLGALVSAGYVRKLKREVPKRGLEGHAIFALIKDTGPMAPKRATDGSIFDPNVAGQEEEGGCRETTNQNGSRGCAPNALAAARQRSHG
jgi:hypothetical protein